MWLPLWLPCNLNFSLCYSTKNQFRLRFLLWLCEESLKFWCSVSFAFYLWLKTKQNTVLSVVKIHKKLSMIPRLEHTSIGMKMPDWICENICGMMPECVVDILSATWSLIFTKLNIFTNYVSITCTFIWLSDVYLSCTSLWPI